MNFTQIVIYEHILKAHLLCEYKFWKDEYDFQCHNRYEPNKKFKMSYELSENI